MKNYCMNFVSIKNLENKAIKNIEAVKGGDDGGPVNVSGGTDVHVPIVYQGPKK